MWSAGEVVCWIGSSQVKSSAVESQSSSIPVPVPVQVPVPVAVAVPERNGRGGPLRWIHAF